MGQPRRIGHFIETGIAGGAEQVMIDLARYCQQTESGYSPVILHFDHPWIREQCELHGIEHHVIPFQRNFKSTVRLPFFAAQFSRWLRQHKIDLLHSHLFGPVTGGALAACIARIPHVGTLHDVYMVQEKPARGFLLKLAILTGTELVTVSRDMEIFYTATAGLRSGSVRTIYNGIDVTNKDLSRQNARQTPASRVPIIICVGRLIPLKNVNLIIRAAKDLAQTHRFKLRILGEGPELDALRNEAVELTEDVISFEGVQKNVDDWLAQADIFVQFSSTEGLSRSILEAVAAGLPAVVSNVGGNREIVNNGINGYLVPAGDVSRLKTALAQLLDDATLRSAFGQAGTEIAGNVFSRSRNNDAYIDLYRQLTGDRCQR